MAISKIETTSLEDNAVTSAKIGAGAVEASAGQFGRRNILINSGFAVNQRGIYTLTNRTSGQSSFMADRWITYADGANWSSSIQEVTLPNGEVCSSLKTEMLGSGTGYFHPVQRVETSGNQHWKGKTVCFSAWIRTNVSGQRFRICDTTTCAEIGDEIPSDGVWRHLYATHTMPTNMATGAGNFIQYQPGFSSGLTMVSGSYLEFALPMMELGSHPSSHEYRSYADELLSCQRYYEKGQVFGMYKSSDDTMGWTHYKVTKRANPSIAINPPGSTSTNYAYYYSTAAGDRGNRNLNEINPTAWVNGQSDFTGGFFAGAYGFTPSSLNDAIFVGNYTADAEF